MNARVLVGAVALASLAIEDGLCADATVSSTPSKVTMAAVSHWVDSAALSLDPSNAPYRFRDGQSTPGQVEDREGNVLLKSGDDGSIYGAEVSPDQKKVLVHLVSSSVHRSVVLEPAAGRSIDLPHQPPGDRMFPFTWKWLGPDLLFGSSGVEVLNAGSNVENCRNEQNVKQVKFYTFDLKTKLLSEVAMPRATADPLVSATDVTGDGHVRLMLDSPKDDEEPDLGWYKIEAPR